MHISKYTFPASQPSPNTLTDWIHTRTLERLSHLFRQRMDSLVPRLYPAGDWSMGIRLTTRARAIECRRPEMPRVKVGGSHKFAPTTHSNGPAKRFIVRVSTAKTSPKTRRHGSGETGNGDVRSSPRRRIGEQGSRGWQLLDGRRQRHRLGRVARPPHALRRPGAIRSPRDGRGLDTGRNGAPSSDWLCACTCSSSCTYKFTFYNYSDGSLWRRIQAIAISCMHPTLMG